VQARLAWQAEQPNVEIGRLVFLDETWASTNMTPTRGRSPIGNCCIGQEPYGHWKTTTLVCAVRCIGLVAPLVMDGPINGDGFRASQCHQILNHRPECRLCGCSFKLLVKGIDALAQHFYRVDVFLKNDLLHRLTELQLFQPAVMRLGPVGFVRIALAIPEQEGKQLLLCLA
jgi:hypothetical protein